MSLGLDKLFFRLSNLFDLFDQYNSQRTFLVWAKWPYSLYLWEQLIDCLMLIMRRFTLRECPFTKERYILKFICLVPTWWMLFAFRYRHLEIVLSCPKDNIISSDLEVFVVTYVLHPQGFLGILNKLVHYILKALLRSYNTSTCLHVHTKLHRENPQKKVREREREDSNSLLKFGCFEELGIKCC